MVTQEKEKEEVHVYPVDDLLGHQVTGRDCWCDPWVDEVGSVIIHNSFDGREYKEK